MDIIWYGVTDIIEWQQKYISYRNELADAAKEQRWPQFFELLKKNDTLINSTRLGGQSLFTPLHQAAYGGASIEVIQQLLDLGAWRTIQNARGERAVDVAERRGHEHLLQILHPVLQHHVPIGILLKIQAHFHKIIEGRLAEFAPNRRMRLPELEPLLELDEPKAWFPVPGMTGGFRYWLEKTGVDAKLKSNSWSGASPGSGKLLAPTSSWLHTCASQLKGEVTWKTYKILGVIKEMNLAKIQLIAENNQPDDRPAIIVRRDTIPPNARTVGTTFRIGGNSIEVRLFENSAPKNLGYDILGPEASN